MALLLLFFFFFSMDRILHYSPSRGAGHTCTRSESRFYSDFQRLQRSLKCRRKHPAVSQMDPEKKLIFFLFFFFLFETTTTTKTSLTKSSLRSRITCASRFSVLWRVLCDSYLMLFPFGLRWCYSAILFRRAFRLFRFHSLYFVSLRCISETARRSFYFYFKKKLHSHLLLKFFALLYPSDRNIVSSNPHTRCYKVLSQGFGFGNHFSPWTSSSLEHAVLRSLTASYSLFISNPGLCLEIIVCVRTGLYAAYTLMYKSIRIKLVF